MDKSTRIVRRSVKQLNDKRSIVNNIDAQQSDARSDCHRSEVNRMGVQQVLKNKVEVTILSVDDYSNSNLSSVDSIEKKLDDFINRVQDDSVRVNCFKKLDEHVNNLLDTVKIREKKRKNAKISSETNGLDKIDLTTPDSILTQINLKNVFNLSTFTSLPLYYQYKLIKLLPKCDQKETAEGWLNINSSALNNEYFTKAYRHWLKQLKESKLNSDFVQKCKADLEKERSKLDPFKVENFEPIWNEPLRSRKNYDEILERERENNLRVKRAKSEENRMQNDLNMKLINFNTPINQAKVKSVRKRTPKSNNRITSNKINNSPNSSTGHTPIKDSFNSPLGMNNTSPISIGSITVRKNMNLSPPISTADHSPTNGKLFYISNNGKLLQIQQSAFQNTHSPIQNNNYIISNNHDAQQLTTNQPDNYLSATCECQQKALVNCSRCQSFCHQECVNRLNICDNCQANSNLVV